ncbi:MAG: hypothetical protein QGH51_03745 [Planctomycetota bacterium]|jgi:hypothetical protein|nr:hypothetical protein [Planctomycetota bacterium]MDP6941121.1 hypothetical protein [Planctomycetota bacterium]
MSTVGKLFVVVNLVLAGLFVGSAASLIGTSQEYRAQFESEQSARASDNAENKNTIADLQGQVDELESQNAGRASDLKASQAENDNLRSQLESSESKVSTLSASLGEYNNKLDDLVSANASTSAALEDAHRDLKNAREERDDALDERESAEAAQTAAEEKAQLAQRSARDLESSLRLANNRATDAQTKLDEVVKRFNLKQNDLGAQPEISGFVTDVSYDGGMPIVIIAAGKDQAVRTGYTFDVWNEHQYKGEIRVEVVNARSSACTIQTNGDFQIRPNDKFATSL